MPKSKTFQVIAIESGRREVSSNGDLRKLIGAYEGQTVYLTTKKGQTFEGPMNKVDISTARLDGWVQYPAGYPEPKRLNPSTRFKAPRQPREVRRNDA